MHAISASKIIGSCLWSALLALGLGACSASSAPLGEHEQPFSAGDGDAEDTAAACADGVAPADAPEGFCQVTARGLCFADGQAACACAGCAQDQCAIAESFPAQAFCPSGGGGADPDAPSSDGADAPVSSEPGNAGGGSNASSGSVGGATSPAAGGSTGCGVSGHADSSPPSTPSTPGASAACARGTPRSAALTPGCDYVVGELCFDDGERACACAGCATSCVLLESYPVQVGCQ